MDPSSYYVPGTITVNVLFAALIVMGIALRGLRLKSAVVLVLLWVVGYVGLPYVASGGALDVPLLFTTYVAILDIVAMGLMLAGLNRLE